MGSPAQFQQDGQARPYVRLTWEPSYWPEVYSNYPRQLFPTEKAAHLFASGSINKRIIEAAVYSKDDVLLEIYGGN